ncbi:MAG: DUF6152 family protein [Dongiaceae bacterium]
MRPDIRTLQFSVLLSVIVALAAAFAMRPAAAHHGWGGYDSTQLLDLTGTIQEVTFENPHGTLRLETPEKTWLIILSPPRRMINRGLEAEMLRVGDTVSVQGYPHKTDPVEMRAERIIVNGMSVELR